jgi:hypothetical protein
MTRTPAFYRAATASELRSAAADRRDAAREIGTLRRRWIASARAKIAEARWCRLAAHLSRATGTALKGGAA